MRLPYRVLLLALGMSFLLPAAVAVRAFSGEYASFDAPGTALSAEQRESARRALPTLSEVSWPGPSGTTRGWFVSGSERAGIVLVHGSGGNRADVLPELEILAKRGFCLLAFDWPGQGESEGHVAWDEPERKALGAALDWLAARPEVDPERMGAFGFSMGGYSLIQEAVTDSRVRAVAVAGTPGNMVDFGAWEQHRFGALAKWPALLAMRARGLNWREQVPDQIVAGIAPRPLLVVLGEADTTVPPGLTRALFEAAHQPKELLALPNVGHGEYHNAGVYAERLTRFFERSLLTSRHVGVAP